ncbi:MAG TPA: heat-inducible transcriptional repressor HrcA [Candidatus Nitrosotenuis sp.]|jgi:heat-inducible transcriptional repressor|nr:heat-inducible transcriptional repressor HrcA [Candidatus Nitrosotenuis sp.]
MLEARQQKILLAVIREHVRTAEPVGSGQVARRYALNCSAATIRHEMARLEEMGYLGQPHTSAGRLPLDRAYRFYVDRLLETGVNPPPEARGLHLAASTRLLETMLAEALRQLSELTRYTALILSPQLRPSLLRYLQLVPLGPRHLLLVLLTSTGQVVQKAIEVSSDIPDHLESTTRALNQRLRGLPLGQITRDLLRDLEVEVDEEILWGLSTEAPLEGARVMLDGTSHLLDQPEFKDLERLRAVLRVLDEEELLAEVLSKTLHSSGLQAWIGSENELPEIRGCSLLSAPYCYRGQPVGSMAILGPTRMPYARMLGILQGMADLLSSRLDELGTL